MTNDKSKHYCCFVTFLCAGIMIVVLSASGCACQLAHRQLVNATTSAQEAQIFGSIKQNCLTFTVACFDAQCKQISYTDLRAGYEEVDLIEVRVPHSGSVVRHKLIDKSNLGILIVGE